MRLDRKCFYALSLLISPDVYTINNFCVSNKYKDNFKILRTEYGLNVFLKVHTWEAYLQHSSIEEIGNHYSALISGLAQQLQKQVFKLCPGLLSIVVINTMTINTLRREKTSLAYRLQSLIIDQWKPRKGFMEGTWREELMQRL